MRIRRRPAALMLVMLCGTLALAGCSSASKPPAASSSASLRGTVTVFAAASLTEVYDSLARRFERLHPRVTITTNYGGSSALAGQIVQGAPADVLATADQLTMKTVTDAGLTDGVPAVFATNVLQLVVPPGNPGRITSISDLTRSQVTVALCDPTVPCGSAAVALFAVEKITVKPVTLEQDVKAVLTKVELGEVDAGVVYVTDAKAAGKRVDSIPMPDATKVINRYPVAVLSQSRNKAVARAFEAFILSKTGAATLGQAGFGAP